MAELPSGTVTFLFTDVQDSTILWEQNPAAMSQALVRHDELIENLAQKHNGFIVRPRGEGDSRFMVFKRAKDSVLAAAAIQKALYFEDWQGEINISVRMGIHTGEGEYRSGDYYGTAVNRCARIRSLARGGQTMLSKSTYELIRDTLSDELKFVDLGEHRLKGLKRPEHVYQLTIPELPTEFKTTPFKEARLPASFAKIPKQIPAFLKANAETEQKKTQQPIFVARNRELSWLKDHLQHTRNGNGRVVFIVGGPGRGKTALVDAFIRQAIDEHPNLLIARGECHSYSGIGDPYVPFRDILAMLTGDIEANWLTGRISTKYARRSWSSFPKALEVLLNYGRNLLGIFVDPKMLISRAVAAEIDDIGFLQTLHQAQNREPFRAAGLDQSHLFEQFTNVLCTLSQQHPLLLILDDMQWTDSASAGLLFHLGRRIAGSQIMIVCAYRPEEVALGRSSLQIGEEQAERHPLVKVVGEFKRIFGNVVLDLGQTEEIEARSFVDAYLDTEPNSLGEEFRRVLFQHTAGHPLFTAELLRAMQERGDLVQEDGVWVEGDSLDWRTLPPRIEGIIDERINRLKETLYEILAVASVEGEVFTSQVLSRVQNIRERELMRLLSRELEERHRLVKEEAEITVGRTWLTQYRFINVIFQQHLYTSLSVGERRILHRSIGEILEELYQDRIGEIAFQLAHHFRSDPERALRYTTLAGEQAAKQFANDEARRYFTRALSLTEEEDYEGRYKLLISREKIFNLLGDREAQRKDLEELSRLVRLLEDQGTDIGRAEVETRWAIYTSHTDYQGAASLAEMAVDLAKTENKLKVAVDAYSTWCNALRIKGEHPAAVHQAEAGISTARDIGDLRGESIMLNLLGLIKSEQGDLITAKSHYEHSLRIAEELGERQLQAPPLNSLGNTAGDEGDYSAALDYYRQALRIAQETGARRGEGLVLGNLGWVAGRLGDYSMAERYYEQQGNIARDIGDRYQETYVAINLSSLTLAQGDTESALRYAKQGLELAREIGDRSGTAWSLTNLGHIHLDKDGFEQASQAYNAALDIRRSLKQPALAMEPLAGLAQAALEQGDIHTANTHVNEIQEYLDTGGSLGGTEEPLRVLLTCYQVLQAAQDPQAESIIEHTYKLLSERAARIKDENLRQKFLENIPCNQAILSAWQMRKG